MTVADRVCALLLALVAGFATLGATSGRLPWVAMALAILGAVAGAVACFWTRSRGHRRTVLDRDGQGRLWLLQDGGPPVPASLGPGSRILGPTVYLEVDGAFPGGARRRRAWLTPLDVPTDRLRRWTVALPGSGPEARP